MNVSELDVIINAKYPEKYKGVRQSRSRSMGNMFKGGLVFCSSKGNTYRLEKKSCNINEPKECISTWQILKSKEYTFSYSGSRAGLSQLFNFCLSHLSTRSFTN